ncbi:hypothetical protein NUH87_31050 [Pseudomonas batumici]|uniref:InvB/SpaK family type III secretion system chaperone n=1 Tax=Pseudomonas batumici TaxID=226910 RepID=UPI0030D45B49
MTMKMNVFHLPTLLRESLEHLGCDKEIVGNVDQHSPIMLEFNDAASIFLAVEETHVWIYCHIKLKNHSVLDARAEDTLRIISTPRDWSLVSVLTGVRNEESGEFTLSAPVKATHLENKELFASVLEDVHEAAKELCGMIQE